MNNSIKGTQTEMHLLKAFAGESQATNRYTFFADTARTEGFEQIADIFEETASNEKEHAQIFFGYLEGGDVQIMAAYPAGRILDTESNLIAAANGERMEWKELYTGFAETAEDEGFSDIAASFLDIASVEFFYERSYRKLVKNIVEGKVFNRKADVKWHCTNCGYIHKGTEPPEECPVCRKSRAYYELLAENY